MSYEIVKGITITNDKVYLNAADSSLRPLHFHKWECEPLSKMLVENGRKAVLCRLGEDVWNGELKLYKGSKLCNLFLKAHSALPGALHWSNTDGVAAGNYLGNAVLKLEADPEVDLMDDVRDLLALRNNKEYILEATTRTGRNYLDFADTDVQKDRAFALKVILAADGSPSFDFPKMYAGDKEMALAGIDGNGCIFRNLDENLRKDHEIILASFAEVEGRKFHEHLPDLIPPMTFFNFDNDPLKPLLDKEFVFELMHACPSLHISRAKWLLQDEDIALEWCKVGKWSLGDVSYIPQEFLLKKEFQDALISRCENEDQLVVLGKKYDEVGLILRKPSLDEKIRMTNNSTKKDLSDEKAKTVTRDSLAY